MSAALIAAVAAALAVFRPFSEPSRQVEVKGPDAAPAAAGEISGTAVKTGEAENIVINGDTIKIAAGADAIEVQVCKDNILKVHYMPEGKSGSATVVTGTAEWEAAGAEIDVASDPMVITTDKMVVKINKKPYGLSVYSAAGDLLIEEKGPPGGKKGPGGKLPGGLYQGGVSFGHRDGDKYYGIYGYKATQQSSNRLLRSKGGAVSAGTQGGCGAPLVWSTGGYGVLVDSDGGKFNIDGAGLEFTEGSREDTEYYILVGKPAEILESVADISGRPPMFPKWAMGFTNSEWGIDQKELLGIVDTYRAKGIPIDNYTLDFDWKAWGEDDYGEWVWNGEKFPDGASGKLKALLDSKGIKLTGILKPRIHVDTVQGKYASENGFWIKEGYSYKDYFSNKKVSNLNFAVSGCREWFWEHLKGAFDTGIAGFWNDEADEGYDNLQFMNMQRALYEGQRAYTDKRVWSINRNFYLGAQRYAYALWSGDIASGFYSMEKQFERMLSAVNLGQVKWGMDTGGFLSDPSPENYARWMQFSAFVPVFRVHGTQNLQRQPWVFGEQAEKVAAAAIKLRYKLIPYIYSYERKAYETGIGLVKPLLFDYPEDENTANLVDSWMFGDYVLVSPVVYEGQTQKDIYLPAGEWIDYFRGDTYDGGRTLSYPIDDKTWKDIPLFIKKGAIIPSQPVMNYVGEKPVTGIDIDVFPDTVQTEFKYYDDDGETYEYENGAYFIQNLSVLDKGGEGVSFVISGKEGGFTPALRYYTIKIHKKAGTDVTCNGNALTRLKSLDGSGDEACEGWSAGKDIYGDVTYVRVAAGDAKEIVIK